MSLIISINVDFWCQCFGDMAERKLPCMKKSAAAEKTKVPVGRSYASVPVDALLNVVKLIIVVFMNTERAHAILRISYLVNDLENLDWTIVKITVVPTVIEDI